MRNLFILTLLLAVTALAALPTPRQKLLATTYAQNSTASTIDAGKVSRPPSIGRSMLYSLVLPGAGQFYLGNNWRGSVFMGTDLLILFSYFAINNETDTSEQNYKNYASAYAGVSGKFSSQYYQDLQNHISSDEYNQWYNGYTYGAEPYYTGDQTWEWENEDKWRHYKKLRSNTQHLETYANMALAAALVNRVVSAVEAVYSARKAKRAYYGQLYMVPNFAKGGGSLMYSLKF